MHPCLYPCVLLLYRECAQRITPDRNKARDAKEIVAAGYDITDITPFDLFPQTRHIENVIAFEKRA
jgi:hypothetical protein